MKNVGPGEIVKNIAYVNGNPTNEVSTRKNPIVKFVLSAEYDDPSLIEGAVFKLTTKEGETMKK